MDYTFKNATIADYEFVFRLKKENYYPYILENWGWNEEEVRMKVKESFEKLLHLHKIIFVNNQAVGIFFSIITAENEYYLCEINLLKEYQNKGIGTKIINDIIKDNKSRNIILQVFKNNPAKNLYSKLGFKIYDETTTHYKMRKRSED